MAVASIRPSDGAPAPTRRGARFERLDALRGLAIVWMTGYHFAFDLSYFGYIRQDFYRDPVWTLQRTAIVGLFLFAAGFGQALAVQAGQQWPRFRHRWLQIVGCALLVSAGSWWMFPRSWISFGVLHGLVVMLLVTRALLMARRPSAWLLGALGLALIAAAPLLGHGLQTVDGSALARALDGRALNWIGVITHKPITEDYVPLLPWLGVVLLGAAAAQRVPAAFLRGSAGLIGRPLAALGRWSLSYYMIHQLVLIGGLTGWRALTGA